jgi:hypothetical protein
MKTPLTFLLIAVCFTSFTANAQKQVALHSNGNTTVFSDVNPFIDAYNASVDGDTIYLSGGSFTSPSLFEKSLTIYGAGYHPDSTIATFATTLPNTTFKIGAISTHLHVEGIEMLNIQKDRSISADNVSFVRCKIVTIDLGLNSGSPLVNSTNLTILECIITGTIDLESITNSVVNNTFIENQLTSSNNNLIQNTIFLKSSSGGNYPIHNTNNSTFVNNIFNAPNEGIVYPGSVNNTFSHNIFVDASPNLGVGGVDNNNYKGVDLTTVYVNQTGYAFDYAHDYHLQTAASSAYLGTDGNEVGIYGGLFPFKAGAVPLNPHISIKNIAPQTDTNGDLNIQLKVNAQDH